MQQQLFVNKNIGFKRRSLLLLISVLIISFNLRVPITTIGPLVSQIRASTGLSNSMLGMLTAIPLIGFGVISATASAFTEKFGLGLTIGVSLFFLTIANGMRAIDNTFLLFLGTAILGICIAFSNVLVPSLTKQYFATKADTVTGLYTGIMAIGTTTAAGFSVPLSHYVGWRGVLGVWGILSFIALVSWLPYVRAIKKTKRAHGDLKDWLSVIIKEPLAWKMSFFMGLQSWSSYCIMAWLPNILQSSGYSAETGGWMLALSQGSGILGSLFTPLLTRNTTNQHKSVVIFCAMEATGLIGLLFFPTTLLPLWIFLIGFPLGSYFTLALLFFVLRARDTNTTIRISGVAQSFGYLLAAPAPILFGALFDLTGGWMLPIVSLLLVVAAKFYTGWGSANNEKL